MGWASASGIFTPVADAMIRTGTTDEQKTEVLSALIRTLLDGDWDTADEVIGEYEDDPAVLEAFRRHGVIIECDDASDGLNVCERERGHEGKHKDGGSGKEW
jgi:hypothetical protein